MAANIAAALGLRVDHAPGPGQPCFVDPEVGCEAVTAAFDSGPVPAAVVARPDHAAALYLALRLTRATVVTDPSVDPEPFRAFLRDRFGLGERDQERRAYPRSGPSGITVENSHGAELIDISPYGARLLVPAASGDAPSVHHRLQLSLRRQALSDRIDCQVVEARTVKGGTEVRLRFARVLPEVQRELLAMAKDHMVAATVRRTFERCEEGRARGFRRISDPLQLLDLVHRLCADLAELTFDHLHEGRLLKATAAAVDESRRLLRVELDRPDALGPVGSHRCYAASARFESHVMDAYVLSIGDGHAQLSLPRLCGLSERRAEDRVRLDPPHALAVLSAGRRYPVTDISPRGLSFCLDASEGPIPQGRFLDVEIDLGRDRPRAETLLVRSQRTDRHGTTIGALFVDQGAPLDPSADFVEVEQGGPLAPLTTVERSHTATPVRFRSGPRRIVGLWTETTHPGPSTVVIVPPAWGRTKESTSLLAQLICASFDANRRRVAVLRFDYGNSLGESDRDVPYALPGHEAMGMRPSECVRDIRAAVAACHDRLLPPPARVVLVGMSLSGPLCLRAAVEEGCVTDLVSLMGVSDIQDLIRTETGGIDYVNLFRSGFSSGVQNLMGLLSDTDTWCADGLQHGLLRVQDAQLDAARLRIPFVWIAGMYDAFVNLQRVRSILEAARGAPRRLFLVPCGHTPTRSDHALMAAQPLLLHLLARAGITNPTLAVPTAAELARVERAEWERAPRTELASPRDFWRDYMIGTTEGSLGFDVLAMTAEYRELMDAQARMLDLQGVAAVADLGCGPGHALPFLAEAGGPSLAVVHLLDLVPELLDRAERRAPSPGPAVTSHVWNADHDELPAVLSQCRRVLVSLFLSTVRDAPALLGALARALPPGATVVASSILPDADLSLAYRRLLDDIGTGAAPVPEGYSREGFRQAVRDYMNSAAWLLRLTEEGTFRLFTAPELSGLFAEAGFQVREVRLVMGHPPRAVVVRADTPG